MPAIPVSSLGRRAVRGALWSTAANLVSRVVTIISTFILTRYLAPEVQGEVNVAFVIISTIGLFSTLGMGQYIVAHPDAGKQVTFHASCLFLGLGVVAFLGTWAVARPLGGLFGAESCAVYMPGFVLAQLLERFASLPRCILARDLRFREIGTRLTLGELVFAASTVYFAARGWGGQAIVMGNIIRAVVGVAYYLKVTRVSDYLSPSPFRPEIFRSLVRYGLPMSFGTLFHYGATTWDNLFISYRFGEATTGLYNQAYRLADLPATQIGEQFGDVLVPSFARVEDKEQRKTAVLRAAGILALVVFPLAIGLGAISLTLVEAFYPPSYAGVGPFLAVLAVLSVFRPIGVLVMGYLQVVGRTLAYMWLDLLKVVTIIGSMFVLSRFGPVWACAGVGIGFGLNAIQMVWAMKPDGYSPVALLKTMAPPLVACGLMGLTVVAIRGPLIGLGLSPWLRLVIEVAVGGIVYVPAALLIAHKSSRELLRLLRQGLKRGA